MNRSDFEQQLEAWIADFRDGALHAFDTKCHPSQCLRIASTIADARNTQRQSERAGTVMMPAGLMRDVPRA